MYLGCVSWFEVLKVIAQSTQAGYTGMYLGRVLKVRGPCASTRARYTGVYLIVYLRSGGPFASTRARYTGVYLVVYLRSETLCQYMTWVHGHVPSRVHNFAFVQGTRPRYTSMYFAYVFFPTFTTSILSIRTHLIYFILFLNPPYNIYYTSNHNKK